MQVAGDVERQNDYRPEPVVDYSQINPHHPEDSAAVERLKSLGCSLTESNGIHTFMGYPPGYEDGQMSDDDFRLVKKLPNLLWLQLSLGYVRRFGLTADAFLHFRQHPELRTVSIFGTSGNVSLDNSLFDHLAEIPRLTILSLVQCQLTGVSSQKMGQVKGLRSLSLRSSRFETQLVGVGPTGESGGARFAVCNVGDDEVRFVSSLENFRCLDCMETTE